MNEQDICRVPTSGADAVGAVCDHCGHNSFVHPGQYTNPSLDECPICRLLFTTEQVEERLNRAGL